MCEMCLEWFHGECVMVTQEEAGRIGLYVCPGCESLLRSTRGTPSRKRKEREEMISEAMVGRLNDDCLLRVFDACGGCPWTLVKIGGVCRRWWRLVREPYLVWFFRVCEGFCL